MAHTSSLILLGLCIVDFTDVLDWIVSYTSKEYVLVPQNITRPTMVSNVQSPNLLPHSEPKDTTEKKQGRLQIFLFMFLLVTYCLSSVFSYSCFFCHIFKKIDSTLSLKSLQLSIHVWRTQIWEVVQLRSVSSSRWSMMDSDSSSLPLSPWRVITTCTVQRLSHCRLACLPLVMGTERRRTGPPTQTAFPSWDSPLASRVVEISAIDLTL